MSHLYKQGLDRHQQLLFPPSLDDYVDSDNSVRAIDSYVQTLDLHKLNFTNTRKSNRVDGQKAYSPKLLLKIYIYGYLNKIRSSRMIERECKRNIELLWLTQGLTPTYHTIANFRRDNAKALKAIFKEFILLCKSLDLIGDGLKAVDGAFLRANASKNTLLMKKSIEKDLAKIEEKITQSIDNYLETLDKQDCDKQSIHTHSHNIASNLPKDIDKLKEKRQILQENLQLLQDSHKTQLNTTDKDAHLMIKPSHNLMAYNAQIVVDDKHKLIVATDISTIGNDTVQLHHMATQTKDNLQLSKEESLEIVGDTGYYSSYELYKCKQDNILAIIPEANRNKAQQDKRLFTRDKFTYNKSKDCYTCPNNQTLHKRQSHQIKNNKRHFIYTTQNTICKQCPLKSQCLPTKTRHKQIYRWEFEEIVESHRSMMKSQEAKEKVKQRGSIVEHPFGTIKRTLGWDHFLVRGKRKVGGENALIAFTYNFKRVLTILGVELFNQLMMAIQQEDIHIKDIKGYILERYTAYIKAYFLFFGFLYRKLVLVSEFQCEKRRVE